MKRSDETNLDQAGIKHIRSQYPVTPSKHSDVHLTRLPAETPTISLGRKIARTGDPGACQPRGFAGNPDMKQGGGAFFAVHSGQSHNRDWPTTG